MRLLLVLCGCLALLPAATVAFGGLRFELPDDWRALQSPSPALLRFACDEVVDEAADGKPVDLVWLRRQTPARRLAMALLPSDAADLAAAGEELRASLGDLATGLQMQEPLIRELGSRRWLELAHSFRFAGQAVHQVTWLTLIDGDADRRCLAVSRSAGQAPTDDELTRLRALLATASD